MLTYRKATLSDCTALTAIRMANLAPHIENECDEKIAILRENVYNFFTNALGDNSLVTWLALDNDCIIATSGLTFFRNAPSHTNLTGLTGYITNMYTAPEFRRRGIGTKLFELTVDEAKSRGCGRIVLYSTGLGAGIYKKYGFTECDGYMTFCP